MTLMIFALLVWLAVGALLAWVGLAAWYQTRVVSTFAAAVFFLLCMIAGPFLLLVLVAMAFLDRKGGR